MAGSTDPAWDISKKPLPKYIRAAEQRACEALRAWLVADNAAKDADMKAVRARREMEMREWELQRVKDAAAKAKEAGNGDPRSRASGQFCAPRLSAAPNTPNPRSAPSHRRLVASLMHCYWMAWRFFVWSAFEDFQVVIEARAAAERAA